MTYSQPDASAPQMPGAPPAAGYWGAQPPQAAPPAAPPPIWEPVAPPPPVQQIPPGYQWRPENITAPSTSPIPSRPLPIRTSAAVGGLITVTTGFVLLMLSATTLNWFGDGLFGTNFGLLHLASHARNAPVLFVAYFDWLAVTLLIVTTLLAFATRLTRPAPATLQGSAALFGLAGALFTLIAPWDGADSLGQVIDAASAGFWCAIVGFMLLCIGSLLRI